MQSCSISLACDALSPASCDFNELSTARICVMTFLAAVLRSSRRSQHLESQSSMLPSVHFDFPAAMTRKMCLKANRNVQHDKRFEDFVSETRNLKKFPSQKANRLETSKRRRRSGSRRKHARDVPLHVKQQASNMQTHFGFGFPSVCSRFCK
jgi:hypothetical protein